MPETSVYCQECGARPDLAVLPELPPHAPIVHRSDAIGQHSHRQCLSDESAGVFEQPVARPHHAAFVGASRKGGHVAGLVYRWSYLAQGVGLVLSLDDDVVYQRREPAGIAFGAHGEADDEEILRERPVEQCQLSGDAAGDGERPLLLGAYPLGVGLVDAGDDGIQPLFQWQVEIAS